MISYSLIDCFAEDVVIKRRIGSGTYVSGYYVPATQKTFKVRMSVQPAGGDDLQMLPEGQRTRNVKIGFCADELKGMNNETDKDMDIVVYDGDEFEVHNVEKWVGLAMNHWKITMIQKDEV